MSDHALTLSVIVVNYNTRRLLRQTLESLFRHPPSAPWEVIVIDNASSDGSASMVAAEFPGARLFERPINEGYGRAVNFAVGQRQAHGSSSSTRTWK
jgi:GT2 family glycosyltransferase